MADERAKLHVPRPPDVDQGVQSFIWAILLGFVIWLFLMGLGMSLAFATIIGALCSAAIFFVVRIFGEEEVTPHQRGER